jgi:hypothetical protein
MNSSSLINCFFSFISVGIVGLLNLIDLISFGIVTIFLLGMIKDVGKILGSRIVYKIRV